MTGRRGAARPAAAGLLATTLVALVAGAVQAPPAAADPPRPTDHRSVVDDIDPATDAVDVDVVGGDAFLDLAVAEGHTVVVEGYEGEPYLRVLTDGTVERNRRSPAAYLNESRDGGGTLPPEADPEAGAEWEQVADGGAYAWHDHRIHWMHPTGPQGAEAGDVIQSWTVPLVVDGEPTDVQGRLLVAAPENPLPWVLLGLASAAATLAAHRLARPARRSSLVAPLAVTVAGAVAVVVAAGERDAAPAGSGASDLPLVVATVGLVAGVAAVVGVVRRDRRLASPAALAGGSAVAGWALLRLEVVSTPVLPTNLPFALDRAGTMVALGLALAAAGLVAWRGGALGATTGGRT